MIDQIAEEELCAPHPLKEDLLTEAGNLQDNVTSTLLTYWDTTGDAYLQLWIVYFDPHPWGEPIHVVSSVPHHTFLTCLSRLLPCHTSDSSKILQFF